MHLLQTSEITSGTFSGEYVFLDTDFLALLFDDAETLEDFTCLSEQGFLTIEPYCKFEFLRNVIKPEQRNLKERFINDPLFHPAVEHYTIFEQISENALLLSRIYAHIGCTGASFVDLYLASRAVIYESLIVTGNKKDFPVALFDTVGVFVYEKKGGELLTFSVLSFNREKYEVCEENLSKVN